MRHVAQGRLTGIDWGDLALPAGLAVGAADFDLFFRAQKFIFVPCAQDCASHWQGKCESSTAMLSLDRALRHPCRASRCWRELIWDDVGKMMWDDVGKMMRDDVDKHVFQKLLVVTSTATAPTNQPPPVYCPTKS